MTRVVIIEDEEISTIDLSELLKSLSHDIRIVRTLDSISDSIAYFSGEPGYDLILMDMHLTDGPSFDIFKYVTITKPILFITPNDENAIKTFKKNELSYLVKPVRKEHLEDALNKYTRFQRNTIPDYSKLVNLKKAGKKWLIKLDQTIRTVNYEDVAYYYAIDKVTYLVNFEGKKYELDQTLDYIESKIVDRNYFKINAQYIVHQKSIGKMNTHTKSRVLINLLPTNEEVIVGAERTLEFKKWLVS